MTPMDPIQAIIFDSDGTLIDSRAAHRSLYGRLKAELGLPGLTAEEEEVAFISTQSQTIERVFPPELCPRARNLADSLRPTYFLPLVVQQPHLAAFLERLVEQKIRLAVNTNAGGEAREIYRRLGLSRFFELVVTADDVSRPKPDSQGVDLILKAFSLGPAQVVFVGDSIIDQRTAVGAGVRFWAYGNSGLTADRHVTDYADLLI